MAARGLKVIGPYRGGSGYDRHTREFVRGFVAARTPVELRLLEGWSPDLPEALRDTWFDGLGEPVGADTTLHFAMPNQIMTDRDRRNVNYTMFEAERIPHTWAAAAARVDLIVLPTAGCLQMWEDSGVPASKLRVVPLGVDVAAFSAEAPPLPMQLSDGRHIDSITHRFLHIGDLRPRKNHLGLLRTWMAATKAGDDAVLILKAPDARSRAWPAFMLDLQDMQRGLGRSLKDAAPVVIIRELLSETQLRSLYASATHYISMSHGEGWDMPMMEAACGGLQLIAPRHTAYTSYLGDDDAHLVSSRLMRATFDERLGAEDALFFAGLNWWNPDEAEAAALLRRIVDGREPPKASPRDRIIRDHDWAGAARRLLEVIFEDAA